MIDLIIIYNHKYEANIPKLDRYYQGKFENIWHLVPFYRGNAENVIPVYDGSFTFQSFIAQAAKKLKQSCADHYLFLSDDLLLDPSINQANMPESFGIENNWGFIAELHDLSKGLYGRGVREARKASLQHPGLEINGELPSFDEAMRRVARHIKLDSLLVRAYTPTIQSLRKPLLKNINNNWDILKANIWHKREQAKNWLNPKQLEYPLIGGYADIFSVPQSSFDEFVHYCGVFAAARIFVEIALPTALALSCKNLGTEDTSPKRGFNVWFPPAPWHEMERKSALLNCMVEKVDSKLSNLIAEWPQDYLYMHPLKLSKWNW